MAEATFTGSIPENYDQYLGPLLMSPFGRNLVNRIPTTGVKDVLELACGTGIVTKLLRERLPSDIRLVATDLSQGMLDFAKKKTYEKSVEWKVADASALPFKDESFDVVVSQFGVMFFPEKAQSMQEIFRVLRPGGRVLFNVWDKIEHNDFAKIANNIIEKMFDSDPPPFYKIPFGFYDHLEIRTLLRNAGFHDIALTTVELKVQADPLHAAKGFVEGNPIADEIKDRLSTDISEATGRVERAIASELGQKIAKGVGQAIIVGARKSVDAKAATKPAEAASAKAQPKPKPKSAKTTTKAK